MASSQESVSMIDQHLASQYCLTAHENAWKPRNNTSDVAPGSMKYLLQNTLQGYEITCDVTPGGSNTFPKLDSHFDSFEKHEFSFVLQSVRFCMYVNFLFSYLGVVLLKWQSYWNRKSVSCCNILKADTVNSPAGNLDEGLRMVWMDITVIAKIVIQNA